MMNNPWITFFIGLGIGLFIAFILFVLRIREKNIHKRELEGLRKIISQKMDIEAESLMAMRDETKKIKTENENLRISVQTLSQNPSKKELIQLEIYQRALDKLSVMSPGFAPAWQTALQEVEIEIEESKTGVRPLLRKLMPKKIVSTSRPKEISNN